MILNDYSLPMGVAQLVPLSHFALFSHTENANSTMQPILWLEPTGPIGLFSICAA